MSIAAEIRKAATGPTPAVPISLAAWVGMGRAWDCVAAFLPLGFDGWLKWPSNDDTRRTLLLLVAEALS